MIDQVCKYMPTHIFSPLRILEAMDIAGFNLSLAGIKVLRGLNSPNKKYSCKVLLPSKSSILRVAGKVEGSADALCPFTMIGPVFKDANTDAEVGEGFEFDVIKTTKTLFESFGFMEDAKHQSVADMEALRKHYSGEGNTFYPNVI
jgi:hypothetical protein